MAEDAKKSSEETEDDLDIPSFLRTNKKERILGIDTEIAHVAIMKKVFNRKKHKKCMVKEKDMTTLILKYKLTLEQKSLLKDLIVYQISKYDSAATTIKEAPYIYYREDALSFLYDLSDDDIPRGDQGIYPVMEDIIKLCKTIPENQRADLKRSSLLIDGDAGLIGILAIYSNKTINGLKQALSLPEIVVASTSSSCWPQKDIKKKKKKTTRMTDEERDRIFGQRFCETKKDITEDDVFGSPVFKNNIDK